MFDPEQEFEYEQKCERIAAQMEFLILDAIATTLEKLHQYFRDDDIDNPVEKEEPF
jgi:hypothetical protein